MPQLFEHIWGWFHRLSRRRGGGFGPAPLTHSGIHDFFQLIRIQPTPWEVVQIEKLDDLYLQIESEDDKKGKPKEKDKDSR